MDRVSLHRRYLHHGQADGSAIIHRDLKPDNILLDSKLVAKLCDFGESTRFNRTTSSGPALMKNEKVDCCTMTTRGTAGYCAPEVVCGLKGSVTLATGRSAPTTPTTTIMTPTPTCRLCTTSNMHGISPGRNRSSCPPRFLLQPISGTTVHGRAAVMIPTW